MTESSNVNQSHPEAPPRSVGELKQLLGVTNISDLATGETPAQEGNAFLEVNASTEDRLHWKPEFFAASESEQGPLRVSVTRVESDALIAAGATRMR